jgi:hypothetical protein
VLKMSQTKETEPEQPKVITPDNSVADEGSTDITVEDAAKQVLLTNDAGTYTMPHRGLYPHQWLWDSCFIAIGQRHYDVDRAQLEILSLLRGQWLNGMIPNIILHPKVRSSEPTYRKHDSIWRSWLNPNAPDDVYTSGITQPPVIAEAVVKIGEKLSKANRRAWYKQVYPALLAYHQWLYSERDPHHEGLVLQVHPWETGLDNTPPWMAELHDHSLPTWIKVLQKTGLDQVVGWFRTDKKFVADQERTTNVEALAMFSVQRRLRRKNYDFSKYIDHALFVIEDLSFNCIFIRANQHLLTIAQTIGKEVPLEMRTSMKKSEEALNELWDDYAQEYFSRDFVSHRLLKTSSIATLLPLYAGCLTKDRAEKLVKLLENEHRFGLNHPVPSVPFDSPWFHERRYWQGPTWINTNWLIIDGLNRAGFTKQADKLRESTIELVQEGGFYEYFSALNGRGSGSDNFSWTAALTIDLLNQEQS